MAREATGKSVCAYGGGGGVQMCVCVCSCLSVHVGDRAQGCSWPCAPSWSEGKEHEIHRSHTAVHGASLEFGSEDYS